MSRRPAGHPRARVQGRGVLVLGAALAGLLLGLAAVNLLASGDDAEEAAGSAVDAYRVVYRVEQLVDDPPIVTWEEKVVRRPFHGLSVTTREPPAPGEQPVSGVLTTADRVYSVSAQGLQEVAGRVPGVPGGDQALGVVLDDAVERRLARPGDRRRVAGRDCRVYRIARPHHRPLGPFEGDDHTDVCIDDAGLLLAEEWTLDGDMVQVRTAVAVDVSPPDELLREALSPAGASPPPPGLEPPLVTRDDGATSFLSAPAPPDGFEPAGVMRVVTPASVANPDAAPGTVLFTSVAWVFVRGPDVVSVEAGEGTAPWSQEDAAITVELTGLGPAQSVLGPEGAELRLERDGRWVRVRGTVAPARLHRYAATLTGTLPGA